MLAHNRQQGRRAEAPAARRRLLRTPRTRHAQQGLGETDPHPCHNEDADAAGDLRLTRVSQLTKPSIQLDDVLAALTGVEKGTLISYTELTKALHAYIKSHNLRTQPQAEPQPEAVS